MEDRKESQKIPGGPPPESPRRVPINWVWFGLFFLVLFFLHFYHILLVESDASFSRLFFLVDALVQCLFEVSVLMCLAAWVRAKAPRLIRLLFALLVCGVFLGHLIDFPLVRLMDMSVWHALQFYLQESPRNFLELLYASNVPLQTWIMGGVGVLVVFAAGVLLYNASGRLSWKMPFGFTARTFGITLFFLPLFLFFWETMWSASVSPLLFGRYQKALPWKMNFFAPAPHTLSLRAPLGALEEESTYLARVDAKSRTLVRRPDIFLFVIESLREDYITQEIAPHLHRFKREHISSELALSNANATQISWFALFHSQFPLHWASVRPPRWSMGSPALGMLKKMGYQICVYTSARLGYYHMDEVILGKDCHLADNYVTFSHLGEREVYECDERGINQLIEELPRDANAPPRVCLVFLDSTHFGYSWPKEQGTRFQPIQEPLSYLKAACKTHDMESIKNRYRNAVFFVDSLFGRFVEALRKTPRWKDCAIMVTGDHGEEFYERGYIFHASDLNSFQTHVPLYYKLGDTGPKHLPLMTTHMDVFPTLFHYLAGNESFGDCFEGGSLFSDHRWPYAVCARYNASRHPCEFFIHNGQSKAILRFEGGGNIYQSLVLQVVALKDNRDAITSEPWETAWPRFAPAMERLFPVHGKKGALVGSCDGN